MKNKKLFKAFSDIDQKFIEEADPKNAKEVKKAYKSFYKDKKRKEEKMPWSLKRKIGLGICASLVFALSLWLFVPYRTTPKSVAEFSDSEYYSIIQKLNYATFQKPKYKNNFEMVVDFFGSFVSKKGGAVFEPETNEIADHGQYQETTDNQVKGIIEGDLIKRSDKNIFYLNCSNKILEVYDINGEDTKKITEYNVAVNPKGYYSPYNEWEMFLSEDLMTVTIITPFVVLNPDSIFGGKNYYEIITLDISDLNNIVEESRTCVTGNYKSSRLIDGKLLIISEFTVRNGVDFSKESNFLPQIITDEGATSVDIKDIVAPTKLTSARYTVLCKIDQISAEVEGFTSFLSYSDAIYVSENNAYITRSYTEKTKINIAQKRVVTKTEIIPVSYSGNEFEVKDAFIVEGSVLNQYSLDEYQGNLRVVTTTNEGIEEKTFGNSVGYTPVTNASLYVINLESNEIVASVEKFAPDGETVQSVRFDKNFAYVCTAIIVTMTDPVFFIDLTDLEDIKMSDSGVIEGYSSSLVDFGEGLLLGIGVGGWGTLKIEIYATVDGAVTSLTSYVLDARFSDNYKAYYIDRQNKLVGLGFTGYNSQDMYGEWYVLIGLVDGQLTEIKTFNLAGNYDYKRGVLIDGYFYAFGQYGVLVEKVF